MNSHDVNQMFMNTLVMYKGVPKLFTGYNEDRKLASVCSIPEGNRETVPFVFDHFKPFNKRLGYVNTNTGGVYIYRLHTRQFKIGLSWDNIRTVLGRVENITFYSPEFWRMIDGNYPCIEDAATIAMEFNVPTAFDRQFAIDNHGKIWYRGREMVGRINESRDSIEFNDKHLHLKSLIGEGYASRFRSN